MTAKGVLSRTLEVILVLILTSMVGLVFGNVVARYVFNSAITWAEEVARFLFSFSKRFQPLGHPDVFLWDLVNAFDPLAGFLEVKIVRPAHDADTKAFFGVVPEKGGSPHQPVEPVRTPAL